MTRKAMPSTERVQEWWTQMQAKNATKLHAVADHGIYRLRAFTNNRRKCGEISLGLRNKNLANRAVNALTTILNDDSPAAVINQYIETKMKHAQTCRRGKYVLSGLADSTEHTIVTIKSRLTAHLLPFCKKRHITNIVDMFRREVIHAYLDYLHESVAIGDTARSIMASTLTLLRWYDGQQKSSLIDNNFTGAIKGWRTFFGFKRSRPKTFLTPEQVQSIFRYAYKEDRIKAMYLFPLVCGLRYNEFVNLRWRDLDYRNSTMNITIAKGGTSRKAQFPKFVQTFLSNVRKSRDSENLDGDYIFRGYNRSRDLIIYKTLLKEITGLDSKDSASNCLRRSGCDLVDRYQHGLGDRQLGHSICTEVTQKSYINIDDYSDINFFWDSFYTICIDPNTIVGVERVRQMAMRPENIIDIFRKDVG